MVKINKFALAIWSYKLLFRKQLSESVCLYSILFSPRICTQSSLVGVNLYFLYEANWLLVKYPYGEEAVKLVDIG